MEGVLPIGSIVSIKGKDTKIFIMGYLPDDMESTNYHDYIGITYTMNLNSSKLIYNRNQFIFNNEDIENIYFIGYQDKKFDLVYKTFKKLKLDLESMDKDMSLGGFFNSMLKEFREVKKVKDKMVEEDSKG